MEMERPRVAIVGGGGAMGRLFARHLAPAARELYLLDFFGVGSRPANLAMTLDELGGDAGGRGLSSRSISLIPPDTDLDLAWQVASGGVDSRAVAAVARITANPERLELALSAAPAPTAAAVLDLLETPAPEGCLVFATPPEPGRELLQRADVVLLALGFESAESYSQTLRYYVPWLRPGSVVVDLGSIKTQPMAVLEQEIDRQVDLIGAHPLFGPSVGDLTGLIVAVVPPSDDRAHSPWRDWFLDQLARLRMIGTPTTATEHDDAMAFVQALTHFVLLSFAYTFVRLDRDPIDLLAFRTPVFEPLLYLAARVAHLARSNPDTYRSIQTFSARPDARLAFLAAARELLDAIESATGGPDNQPEAGRDPLVDLFRRYGGPWSPDGRDRRERQRREHFLEMGARLVDNLNHLRQDVIGAIGQVRGVEEQRTGQPSRVVVGVVDVDLLAPGKQDVASRIRLRRLNLPLGSVLGDGREDDGARDHLIPLARARILSDGELLDWLYQTEQLIERRRLTLAVPDWFDRDVLRRLLKGITDEPATSARSQIWDVSVEPQPIPPSDDGLRTVGVELAIILHPADLVETRQTVLASLAASLDREIEGLGADLARVYQRLEVAADPTDRARLNQEKNRLKHERKAAVDRRVAEVDRAVREAARQRVQRIADTAQSWLLNHGCQPGDVCTRNLPSSSI